jgi:hypothetical protein
LDIFILEVEEKVMNMVGEFTLNEYKAYKHIVKHKKRENRVFSELGATTTLRSRLPGVDKKVPAVVVVGYSAAPPKARWKRALKKEKAKNNAGDTSSPAICPSKTKSLESSKRKRKASESTFEIEIQAASGLANLSRKKSKKVVKRSQLFNAWLQLFLMMKPKTNYVNQVILFVFYCMLRWGLRSVRTPGSENEFVDVETFSDALPEAQDIPEDPITVASFEVVEAKTLATISEAPQKFSEELEHTVDRSDGSLEAPLLIGNRKAIPDDQDPSPEVAAYNASFGTSFRGELLSVECPVTDEIGGDHSLSVLWHSPKFIAKSMSGTGGDASRGMPLVTDKAAIAHEGRTSSPCEKSVDIANTTDDTSVMTFDSEGLVSNFSSLFGFILHEFLLFPFFVLQHSIDLFKISTHQNSHDSTLS